MRIDVVGGGAIGLLASARLARAGADITLWTRTERQRDKLNEEGISLLGPGDVTGERIAVRGACMAIAPLNLGSSELQPNLADTADGDGSRWILLAVKQGDIGRELLNGLAGLAHAGHAPAAVLCLQNGIGHIAKLSAALGEAPIYAAVTTEGAKREGETAVRHTGEGGLWIGENPENGSESGHSRRKAQKMLLSTLQKAGFAAFLSNDIKERVYRKLLVNAVINPLTAIYDVPNGKLPQHPLRLALMRRLHEETERVLLRAGMTAQPNSWEALLEVCGRTAANISSMLADVRAGRMTEIAEINGAVVALAEESGLRASLNEAVAAMVEALNDRIAP